jgi:hypothetical protein
MNDNPLLVDDLAFSGIFNDIDRATKSTAQRLQAEGMLPSHPKFNEIIDSIPDLIKADRREVLYREAIDAGRPQEYANYRGAAYLSGDKPMSFDVWTQNRRHAASAEIGDFVGQNWLVVEDAVASAISGTAGFLMNQVEEGASYRPDLQVAKDMQALGMELPKELEAAKNKYDESMLENYKASRDVKDWVKGVLRQGELGRLVAHNTLADATDASDDRLISDVMHDT